MAESHLIGLLLGTEEDWPRAVETLVERLGPIRWNGTEHRLATERIVNEPFDLRYKPRYSLVIDRLAWWYDLPREWLKKVSLMDDVYLLNNPFTFQAMEKHSAYCAMMRLGLKVPATWMVPHKQPAPIPRFDYMRAKFPDVASRYNAPFDLDQIGEFVGYPLYLKPFDGGQWVGVTRVASADDLHGVYDTSGERLMHLQAAVEDFDVFTRSLSIGPQTQVMQYDPSADGHYRYSVGDDFLPPEQMREVETIGRLVNAFFRWEFNSCEVIVKDGETHPIDYANASPDMALVSLHYYFPWAIEALAAWCMFCAVTDRRMRVNQNTRDYFEVGDSDLPYDEKLERYRELADAYFQTELFEEFRAEALPHLKEATVDYVESPEFDRLIVEVIRTEEPEEKQERLIERSRTAVAAWAAGRRAAPARR
ncbi:MAG TPA: hypothetical protein VKA24_12380 [Gaiellaceae bacterium]|nr:hypothetical protein [Gaiellaceae bacterium]